MSNWDVRGYILDSNLDNLDNNNKKSFMMDTEPLTGDQLADGEKVLYSVLCVNDCLIFSVIVRW